MREFPLTRLRRTRMQDWSRRLVSENTLTVNDLIWPIFIIDGQNKTEDVKAMPGVRRMTIDIAIKEIKEAEALGIPAVALFPVTPEKLKNAKGTEAQNPNNLVCTALREIKRNTKNIGLIADVALDPYTMHGHDGILDSRGLVDNDPTVEALVGQAMAQAIAGCDVIAPSDMQDGRILAIRSTLEDEGLTETQIMSYAAKYASKYYGPFKEAVGSAKSFGGKDKKHYQQDPANILEALREVEMDIAEGADMVMVKPGMPYLDVLKAVKDKFGMPTYSYQVSGEYAMLKAAAQNGWLDGEACMLESLLCFKRTGADGILTYFAKDVAELLKK